MITGSIKGVKNLNNLFKKMSSTFDDNRNMAVKEATLAIHAEAIQIVSENSGGKAGMRYDPKRTVTVSKPNTPPHTDTGRLRQGIKFNYKDGIGQVGSNLKYAAWLEFGTSDMAPRPWLSVAISRTAKDVSAIFNKWFNKAIKEIKS